ncbi:DNA-3-methyladenine glycosylase [Fluviispira multicolorata]|uniref:Putative 3-methyladenine DNA glycosylase n=1 Tax=Fluviispira multicolorata TaxID=2654512 RepID=A0A833JB17_9BACT|nr:DNA-3-methyladenine glycosylase [Fluviispira multicolorata]KAB8027993.1 DNA-3-methyladenine glycosylase [Fluviispira multicolorata]
MNLLDKDFFKQNATELAPKLLGMTLCHITPIGTLKKGIIVETEAYMPDDPACHAAKGKTKRTLPMFEEGGISYVYLIYGMYYCFNIVSGEKNSGQAVLIRALQLPEHPHSKEAAGPGKLCRYLEINKSQNGIQLSKENKLWLEKSPLISNPEIVTTTRIGISAGKENLWRFYIKNSNSISKK